MPKKPKRSFVCTPQMARCCKLVQDEEVFQPWNTLWFSDAGSWTTEETNTPTTQCHHGERSLSKHISSEARYGGSGSYRDHTVPPARKSWDAPLHYTRYNYKSTFWRKARTQRRCEASCTWWVLMLTVKTTGLAFNSMIFQPKRYWRCMLGRHCLLRRCCELQSFITGAHFLMKSWPPWAEWRNSMLFPLSPTNTSQLVLVRRQDVAWYFVVRN